jgi:hypothetical protein
MNMNKLPLLVYALAVATAGAATEVGDYKRVSAEAQKRFMTDAGHAYALPFAKSVGKAFYGAMQICQGNSIESLKCDVVLVLAADGKVERTLCEDTNVFARCLLNNLHLPAKVARPPGASWPVQVHLLNRPLHRKAGVPDFPALTLTPPADAVPKKGESPKDVPLALTSTKEAAAYDRRLAPYVAKGRATYPAAKKRFLSGLPRGHHFAVKARLKDKSGHFEDCFIGVRKIENGRVFGVVDSQILLVEGYKSGQPVVLPESQVDDWVIVRPDGSEEGNFVGKFMDTAPR